MAIVGEGNFVESKALSLFRNVVIAAFLTSLAAGIFLPIYTDEVGWRFQERAAFDGVDKLFNNICGPNTLAVPPFFMWPVRYFSAYLNAFFADPMYIRFSGVGYAIIWALMLLKLIKLIARDPRERDVLTIIGLGLMSLGTLPLLLIWSRPEQPILLAMTATLITTFTALRKQEVPAGSADLWWRSIFIALCGVVAASYHFKGLVVFPVFAICLWAIGRGRKTFTPQLVSFAVLVVVAGLSAHYWTGRLECPDDPVLQEMYAKHNIAYAILGKGDWFTILKTVIGNLRLNYTLSQVAPNDVPMSFWLALNQISSANAETWLLAVIGIWYEVILVVGFCLIAITLDAFRNRRLDPKYVLSVIMLGAAMAWTTTQLHRNVYEAILILPMFMIASLLALAGQQQSKLYLTGTGIMAALLGLVALISPIMVGSIFAPSLAHAWEQRGYVDVQEHSLPVLGYSEVKPDILEAARICGIAGKKRPNALLLDELTYFAFMDSYRPQLRLGVLSAWRGSIKDPIAYLQSIHSDGIVVGCKYLDPNLRKRAKQVGQICCIAPPGW